MLASSRRPKPSFAISAVDYLRSTTVGTASRKARGEKKQAADYHRKAIGIICQHPRYDLTFADVLVKLVDKLDPPLLPDYPVTTPSIGEGATSPATINPAQPCN
jgi:hypothetical protein